MESERADGDVVGVVDCRIFFLPNNNISFISKKRIDVIFLLELVCCETMIEQ